MNERDKYIAYLSMELMSKMVLGVTTAGNPVKPSEFAERAIECATELHDKLLEKGHIDGRGNDKA